MMYGIVITSFYVAWQQSVILFDHEVEGTGSIWNTGNYSPINTVPSPRRLEFSAALLWEPQISQKHLTWVPH